MRDSVHVALGGAENIRWNTHENCVSSVAILAQGKSLDQLCHSRDSYYWPLIVHEGY